MKKITISIFFFYLIIRFFVDSKDPASSLEKITEFRQQHRKTLDGRLCAAAFLHDDQTYTDCTDAVSPDGTSGREWCYVEVQLLGKGPRDWDYCTNAINYDRLRIHAKKVFEEKSLEADRLKDRLNVLNSRVHSMLQKFNSVCGKKHELISSRIEKINQWLTKSEDSLIKIENNSNDIDSTKSIIDKLQIDIKNESEISKQSEENCKNSPGYEDEPQSDGLKVSYFNNPFFEGVPIESSNEKNINFSYNNRGPLDNISPYKYSIRYEGFLLAPHNGPYVFIIETDCFVRLLINNKYVLVYGFEEVKEENSLSNKSIRYSSTNDDKSGIVKKKSKPIELIGGEKHKFVLEVSHSSHLKFNNEESATFKLLWKSSRIDEEVIQSHYFFSEHVTPPTRISSLNADFFEISLLDINENAFKNDTNWLITKVPSKYNGLHLIRTEKKPEFTNFSLSVNTGSNLFIAAPVNEVFPLSPHKDSLWKAFDTEDILEITHNVSKEKKKLKIKVIPLKNRAELKFNVLSNIPFLIFAQKRKILPTICNGEEEVLSSPENKVFKECIESSALSNEFNCLSGLSNPHMDKKYSTWRSANSSIGEYIKVFFNRPVQINKFRFKPRDDMLTWPSEISLHFDDTELIIPVLHTSNMDHNTFKLEHPVITTSVKIEIRDMFVNNDETGGSFELIGNDCNISDDDYMSHHATIDIIECNNTLNDIPDVLPLINGDKFLVTCDFHCIETLNGEVYGSDIYSTDSALCKTAVHAGICSNENKQNCKFLILINDKQENFVGKLQNSVLSLNKNKNSNLSFTISPAFTQAFSHLYSSTPNSYSIVFKRNDDLNLPNKFLIDSGNIFKDYGPFAYGWNKPITFLGPLTQKNTHTNGLYSGGINFPPASASEHCITDIDCQTNFWKFQTHENGVYTIQVLIGNIHFDDKQNSFIEVNGLPLIKNVQLQKNEYFVAVKNVQVTNRSLIFTSTCLENESECARAKTTILAIQIVKI